MKNYLKMTLIAAMAIPMLFSLSSCNLNDEFKDEEPAKTYKGSFEFTYNASADLLAVANIEISYNDETGKLVTETVTTTQWTKKVIYKKLPATAGFKIAYTVKNPLPKDKPSVHLVSTYEGGAFLLDAKTDKRISGRPAVGNRNTTVKIENVETALKLFNASKSALIETKGVSEGV
ncbi:MAG: hypothetical protein RR306_07015 [Clostridia bacterium]